ncbi:MAG: discoidin domain-containing protein [Prevotella sp.]|nr:discoidin domain-containing protein [Prevotella sp.]
MMITMLFCLISTSMKADTTQPWTFWYWMYGAVSEEGIRADLKAMKDVGLGGCYLMPIRGAVEKPEYEGKADALSDNFWRMIDLSLQQADSLGLDMGIHICDGFALAGGPWIQPEESMQRIVYCDTIVTGRLADIIRRKGGLTLQRPKGYDGYYEDIATFAIPLTRHAFQPFPVNFDLLRDLKMYPVTMSPTMTRNAKGIFAASEPAWIAIDMGAKRLFTNIEIAANGTNIQGQRMAVEASDDGVNFRLVKQLVPPRQGWQNYDHNTTFTIPPTEARYWRLSWTPSGTEPGSEDLDAAKWRPRLGLKNATFYCQPRIDNWEGKAGYVWRIAPQASSKELPDSICWQQREIARLTLDGDKVTGFSLQNIDLDYQVYRIIRIGHTSTGHTNATAGGAKGLECDKFSPEAVSKQVHAWFGQFKQRPHADVIKYLHVDSWECGSQNWGYQFAQEFQKRRGYDLLSWLPVMVGIPIESAAKSDQVLRDVRLTINELINEKFFATVAQKAREYGVGLSSESVAPTMVSDGMDHYRYADIPMGEYWLNSPTHDKPNDMLDAISGAHVYGKPIVQAEGFTEVRGVWDETPASIKPLLDRNFALGMNRLFFHVNTHNPWLDRKPGMTLDGIGLFFQRDQTWFPEAKAFVDYVTRCQRLLQQGKPVVDIAVYTGEEMPRRAFTPDRIVPMLPGLFGAERIASERKRLANVGQPMVESPVGVWHSAGIVDLKDWVNPLHGYQYDSMNKDALLHQPFHYKVLVVPQWLQVSPEARNRINELRQQGVLVIDKPYRQATLPGIAPDIVLPEGIAYCHRTTGDKDIYFLSNQTAAAVSSPVAFRNSIRTEHAVVYDPVNDESRHFNDTIALPPYGSCFVIISPYGAETLSAPYGNIFRAVRKISELRWDIHFKESNITLKDQPLQDWSQSGDDRIRYFSGHARYTTTLKLKAKEVPAGRAWLTLPDVRDIAHVWVNGRDCGTAWTAPYEVEITGALKKGKNLIEIEVVNTWHNALRGLDQGKAPYDGIWTNARYRTKGDGLLPAGLLEPPVLKFEK